MSKINVTSENIKECVCPSCPVQQKSECSKKKEDQIEPENAVGVDRIPYLYCAVGKSDCSDMDFNQMCICPSCPVYENNNLKDMDVNSYFCQKGSANE